MHQEPDENRDDSRDDSVVDVRYIGGEITSELAYRTVWHPNQVHPHPINAEEPWKRDEQIVDLVMAVLVRHLGKTLIDYPESEQDQKMRQQKNTVTSVRLLRTIPVNSTKHIPVLAGPSDTLLVVHGSEIEVQSRQSGSHASPLRILKKHYAPIIRWGVSRDGSKLASLDSRGSLDVSEVVSGRTLHRIALPAMDSKSVSRLTLSPDERYVAMDHPKLHYCVADLHSGKIVFVPPKAASGIFSPDGKTLVTGGMWWLQTWKVGSWKPLSRVNVGDAYTTPVAYAPEGKTLFTVTQWFKAQSSAVQQMGADSLTEQARFSETGGDVTFGTVTDAVLSPDGRWLAVGIGGLADGSVPTLALWDVRTRQPISLPRLSDPTTAVLFSPEGRFLVSVSRDATRLWEFVFTGT